jgi:hypothetical protein
LRDRLRGPRCSPTRHGRGWRPRARGIGRGRARVAAHTRVGSRRRHILQLLDPRGPDAGDGVELLERAERAVLLAIVEDLLGRTAQPGGWAGLSTETFYRCPCQPRPNWPSCAAARAVLASLLAGEWRGSARGTRGFDPAAGPFHTRGQCASDHPSALAPAATTEYAGRVFRWSRDDGACHG